MSWPCRLLALCKPNGGLTFRRADTSTPLTVRIRCSPTRSVRYELSRWGTNLVIRSWVRATRKTSLLQRLVQHVKTTAEFAVYYGDGRDFYDVWGRTAHESIFNLNDGNYRCPNSQQGFSPFTTWTRGLAWIMVGAPEQLEFLETVDDAELEPLGGARGD